MLYDCKEVLNLFGNDYKLKKAILDKRIFKIEKGIYSDGEKNFTTIEIILKKYKHAFLAKDTALHLIGFIEKEPAKIHTTKNNNEIRLFNLKALFFDLVRNYKDYPKSNLFALLEKFETCRYFHGLTRWELEENLRHEKIVGDIEFLDDDLYEKLEDIFSEVKSREFSIEFDLDDL